MFFDARVVRSSYHRFEKLLCDFDVFETWCMATSSAQHTTSPAPLLGGTSHAPVELSVFSFCFGSTWNFCYFVYGPAPKHIVDEVTFGEL
jgi:hypothetical protein